MSFAVCSDFVDHLAENVFEDSGEASEREWKTSELAEEVKGGQQRIKS